MSELDELKKKLIRKTAAIEELTEQLQEVRSGGGGSGGLSADEKNEMFLRLQNMDWEIKKVTTDRKKVWDRAVKAEKQVRELLRARVEDAEKIVRADLAIAYCADLMLTIQCSDNLHDIHRHAESFLARTAAQREAVAAESSAQQLLLEDDDDEDALPDGEQHDPERPEHP